MSELIKLLNLRYGDNGAKKIKQIVPKFVEQIISRGSIRRFSKKKVSDEIFDSLIVSAQSAPTKSNLQQYSILNISDKKIKKEIGKLLGEISWATEAPLFFYMFVFVMFFCCTRARRHSKEYLTDTNSSGDGKNNTS